MHAGDPVESHTRHAARLRSPSLSRAASRRELLSAHQATAPHLDALREARSQLSQLPAPGRCTRLAPVARPRLHPDPHAIPHAVVRPPLPHHKFLAHHLALEMLLAVK